MAKFGLIGHEKNHCGPWWLFVTLVLTPLLASWLSALGGELKWFDSPSNQIQFLLQWASTFRTVPIYKVVVVAFISAIFGYFFHWMLKRKGLRPEIPIAGKLVVTADAIEASRRIGVAIEAIEKAITITSQGGPIEDQMTYVAGQIAATSLSLSALGVQLPILNREHPIAYLQSYKSLFEAVKPLIETGHIQAASDFASGLEGRLSVQYLHRQKSAQIDAPKLSR